MKKAHYLSFIGLTLSLIGTSAYANLSAQNGFYIDANGGYSGLMAPRAPTNYSGSTLGNYKVTGSTWSANTGYQWALDTFSAAGFELGYSQDGTAKYNGSGQINDTGSLKFDSSSIDMLATFNTMWNSGINVFFKGGVAWQSNKATLTGPLTINGTVRQSGSSTEKEFAPLIEMGIGYMVTNNLDVYSSVRGILGNNENNWSYSNTGNDYNNTFGAYQFRVGISYLF